METARDELFSGDGLFLPPIQPGETLYSWCAHYHTVSSNSLSENTSRILFGHPSAGLQSAFPFCLDTLTSRTTGLGSAEDIVFQKTPLGIFARFLQPARVDAVIEAMRASRSGRIPHSLGLPATGLGLPAPLKACSMCIQADLAKGRIAHWRTDHQRPGVLLCSDHEYQLLVATRDAHLRTQSQFLLPHQFSTTDWRRTQPLGNTDQGFLRSLANWSRTLSVTSRRFSVPFDPGAHHYACHLQAKKRGWVAIDGTLRFKQIREEILSSYGRLTGIPTLEFIADAGKESGGFVGILLRSNEGFHHPLMHLVLLSFLFASPQDYELAYQACLSQGAEASAAFLTQDRSALRAVLAEMVGIVGYSVSRAAREVGINLQLALALLKEQDVSYKARPRIIGTAREKHLVLCLERGDDPNEIARELSVRRSFIKDYLAARPGLRAIADVANLARRRDWYRSRFQNILADNPSLPIKRIRREMNSGFEWLYRNDREWLEAALPGIWHRPKP